MSHTISGALSALIRKGAKIDKNNPTILNFFRENEKGEITRPPIGIGTWGKIDFLRNNGFVVRA